jgi:hypothetical protein
MLFKETVAVYCENHTEHTHTHTHCGRNTETFCVKAGVTYSDHWAVNSLPINLNSNILV